MNMQQTLKWSMFIAATAGVVYLCAMMLQPFLLVIAWSVVLAILFHPLHRRIARKTDHAPLSALMTSALVVLVFVVPLLLIAGIAVSQLLSATQSLEERLRAGAETPDVAVLSWVSSHLGIAGATVAGWLRLHTSELAGTVGQYTLSIAASVTGAIVSFGFIIFALSMMLLEGPDLIAAVPDLLPFDPARSRRLLLRMKEVVQGSVYGVLVIAVIHGALSGGMFWLLGIPFPALWGLLTVFTSMLPVIGAAAVWGPGVIYLIAIGSWERAIVLGVFCAVVFSGIDHILRPRLIASRIGLNQLAMFFALLGGVHVFGILGIVLGPVMFATADAILQILREPQPTPAAEPATS